MLIFIATALIVSESFLSSLSSVRSANTENFNEKARYVVDGVPYTQKVKGLSCDYGPLEMVFRYYGINISKYEIFYFSGGGYSMGYGIPVKRFFEMPPRKPPYSFTCVGDLSVGGPDDYRFLANLFGLSFEIKRPKGSNDKISWNRYWTEVKSIIINDTPIVTLVDPLAWPLYREKMNITKNFLLSRSCCVIVIVGFNETNKTVCVNDQYVGYTKGFYRWVKLEDFRTAVKRAYFELRPSGYSMYIIKKISTPLPNEIVYGIVHQRNIQKMKGIRSSYDGMYIQKNFKEFGIDALKALQKDFKTKFTRYMPIYYILNKITKYFNISYPFHIMSRYFHEEAKSKIIISELLMEREYMHSYHKKNAILLKTESMYWQDLSILSSKLRDVMARTTLVRFIEFSQPIIDEMIHKLDNIIDIEKMIVTY